MSIFLPAFAAVGIKGSSLSSLTSYTLLINLLIGSNLDIPPASARYANYAVLQPILKSAVVLLF